MEQYSTERFQTVWCPLLPYSLLGFQGLTGPAGASHLPTSVTYTVARPIAACHSTASTTATSTTATLQPICSLYYSVYSLYSYSSYKTFYETYNLPQWPSAPGAHTHTGFFFKGFLPLDTREPRISFSPNHFTLFLHSLEHFLAHLEGGGGAYTVYGSLSLSPHR